MLLLCLEIQIIEDDEFLNKCNLSQNPPFPTRHMKYFWLVNRPEGGEGPPDRRLIRTFVTRPYTRFSVSSRENWDKLEAAKLLLKKKKIKEMKVME